MALVGYLCVCFGTYRKAGRLTYLATGALVLSHLWIAFGFMMQYYLPINYIAKSFAGGFVVQSLLILLANHSSNGLFGGVNDKALETKWRIFGIGLLVLAGIYPLLEMILGKEASASSVFALTPDPTVIGFIGLVLISSQTISRIKRALLLTWPILWCFISGLTLIGLNNLFGVVPLTLTAITLVFVIAGPTPQLPPKTKHQ